MKKVVMLMLLSVVFLFGSIDFQKATKSQLMGLKGIGSKKADLIIEYRKKNKIQKVDDLKNIKGFGDKLIVSLKKQAQ